MPAAKAFAGSAGEKVSMYRYASTVGNGLVARSGAEGQEGPADETLRGEAGGRLALLEPRGEGGLRLGLIARVREEIAAGTYDTPEKLEIALGRLLERF
jgi:hypothetical protein